MCRHSLNCIIPSYMLEAMLKAESESVRAKVMQTLIVSERIWMR